MKLLIGAAIAAALLLPAAGAHAADRVMEPSSQPVKITYDAQGKPVPFTVKVGGFKPNDLVAIEQCDGLSPQDPNWGVTLDCDTATAPAQRNADANGVVTFPANDVNFGFQPIRGTSPQKFFNCLGPGDADPHNDLHSYTTCNVRVATSFLKRTTDEVFIPMQFSAANRPAPSASSRSTSSSSHTVIYVVIGVLVVLAIAGGVVLLRRT
jgi:hypothetical protein